MDRTKLSVFDFVRLTGFGVFNLTSTVILAVLTLGLWGTSRVEAGIVINTPAGLTPGDTFRVAFVTDATRDALSANIADYNLFVNADATTEAGGGSVTYKGNPLTFSAIGSTEAVSAISNIGQTGAPVYLVDGTPIALSDTLSSGGLWSGTIINPLNEDLTAHVFSEGVWTGTLDDGEPAPNVQLHPPSGHSLAGITTETDTEWVNNGLRLPDGLLPLYGISAVLTVPAVPEPSALILGMIAAGSGAVGAYVRRRKACGGR